MSIIERNSPLNLQYKVCIVTNASSPLGVVICKTLLKANALVLGVDDKVRDQSLNAGLGTHFQFEQVDLHDADAAEAIVESAKRKFEGLGGGGRVDALVDLVDEDDGDGKGHDVESFRKLSLATGEVMKEGNGGSIVVVPGDAKGDHGSESLIELARDLSQQHVGTVRCNVITLGGTTDHLPSLSFVQRSADSPSVVATGFEDRSEELYHEAQTHMEALMKTERPASDVPASKQVPPQHYAIANLVLFLAGGMSEVVIGRRVNLDGAHCALQHD
ncbi:hypothetical protein B0A48_11753 [Cryoendolithus antarcticus]|uniref:Uncharacterized protein n=1 Tax=Cryoendolithus antarcticus TaxID=1507870 RepID=A0A1V8ST12_9PEZI|nr:hypothetical protein B0A48_11753 [Cryoendolithus antarcticus]